MKLKHCFLINLFLILGSGAKADTMLFLHGMQSRYGNVTPQKIEEYAKIYAEKRGYQFEAIPVSGDYTTKQRQQTVERIKKGDVSALYGFSAGGYNIKHIMSLLSPELKAKIKDITILGSPGERPIKDISTHIYRDPPQGHMQGPKMLAEKNYD